MAAVVSELADVTKFVYDEMDWSALGNTVLRSEALYFSALYISFKVFLGKLESKEKEKGLDKMLIAYNVLMSLFSLVSSLLMIYALVEIVPYGNDCKKAFRHPIFDAVAKAFYYSKFFEYIDSISLILKGKKVTFLQGFHHLGAPWDMFMFYNFQNEAVWIFVVLNGIIHTIMYAYYASRLIKKPFPMPKPLITGMQITQFLVGFYLVWTYKDVPCYRNDANLMFAWLFNYWYVGTVLTLFMNFFMKNYLGGSKKAKKL